MEPAVRDYPRGREVLALVETKWLDRWVISLRAVRTSTASWTTGVNLRHSSWALSSFARLRATLLGHVVPAGRRATKLRMVDTAFSITARLRSPNAALQFYMGWDLRLTMGSLLKDCCFALP